VKRNYLRRCSDEQITQSIISSNSASEAIIKLGYNASERPKIKTFAEENNLDISHFSRVNQRTYTLNEDFFETLNEISAYWLGFIMADGNVESVNYINALKIHLSIKDEEHLVNFYRDISYNGKLTYYKGSEITSKGHTYKTQPSVKASIASKKLIHNLISLGCMPNKTVVGCQISDKIPHNLLRHFMRGYFDGDGSVVIDRQERKGKKYKPQLSIFLLGDLNFLEKVKKIMMDELDLNDVRIAPRKGIFCLKWAGNTQCKKIYDWFYHDSMRFLPRKKIKFEEVIILL